MHWQRAATTCGNDPQVLERAMKRLQPQTHIRIYLCAAMITAARQEHTLAALAEDKWRQSAGAEQHVNMRSCKTQARTPEIVVYHGVVRTLVKRQMTPRLDRLRSTCLACTCGIVKV